jgi:hypothetical protein
LVGWGGKQKAMKTTKEYLRLLKAYKAKAAKRYSIARIGIFGSVARGEQKEGSDVDVCVELSTPDLFYLVHIKEELQALFGCPVDVVRIHKNMNQLLEKSIMEDSIYA